MGIAHHNWKLVSKAPLDPRLMGDPYLQQFSPKNSKLVVAFGIKLILDSSFSFGHGASISRRTSLRSLAWFKGAFPNIDSIW